MREDRVADLVREIYARKLRGVDLTEAILERTTERAAAPKPLRSRWRPFPSALALAASVAMLAGAFWARQAPRAVATESTPRALVDRTPSSVGNSPSKPRVSPVVAEPDRSAALTTHTTALDFGRTHGAIFLVSSAERDTMVVWTFEESKDEG